MSGHIPGSEPYDGAHLRSWLMARYRPNLLPQSNAHISVYELPSGMPITIPGPSSERRPVSSSMARRAANALGMSFDEYREAIEFPVINHGKPKRGPVRTERRGCSKTEVLASISDVRGSLTELEQKLRTGAPRDPAFYAQVNRLVLAALTEANRAVEQTTKVGTSGKEGQVQSYRSGGEKRAAHKVGPHRGNR